ncbi:hypothetical protein BDR07DRAFT_1380812 [Suillus spraguei]|nr:hypothetical protein BDR07DRAFT_1383361 [Suillus spraguei]KAG2356383.1 hypothetical protein BDR07DRAFT_1380812 [Suillus spraguei]
MHDSVLNQVEFRDLDDIKMSRAPAVTPIPISPVAATPIPPVTPQGFNAATQPFVVPSISMPAFNSGEAGRHESRPQILQKERSVSGSSKVQHLTMLVALEEMGDKVADMHIMEHVPTHKQRAMLRVQEEKDLDDYDAMVMINLFKSDITIADAYNNIT